jgi:ribose transport system permease protein
MFGRHVVAMGGNVSAAYICGINIKNVRMLVFCLTGLGAALAAVVLTGRTASAQVSAGVNLEMDCITAVVVGGTTFSGGVLNVPGTLFGSLIVGVINNGLNLLGVDSNFQIIAKGVMIMLALVVDKVSTMLYAQTLRKRN